MSRMVRENVIAQPANLRTHPSVALMLKRGRMNLYGGVYDIETGGIDALVGATRRFAGLAESPIPRRRQPRAFGLGSVAGYALRAQCPPLQVILRGAG